MVAEIYGTILAGYGVINAAIFPTPRGSKHLRSQPAQRLTNGRGADKQVYTECQVS